jgi:hypothetical protein
MRWKALMSLAQNVVRHLCISTAKTALLLVVAVILNVIIPVLCMMKVLKLKSLYPALSALSVAGNWCCVVAVMGYSLAAVGFLNVAILSRSMRNQAKRTSFALVAMKAKSCVANRALVRRFMPVTVIPSANLP